MSVLSKFTKYDVFKGKVLDFEPRSVDFVGASVWCAQWGIFFPPKRSDAG